MILFLPRIWTELENQKPAFCDYLVRQYGEWTLRMNDLYLM